MAVKKHYYTQIREAAISQVKGIVSKTLYRTIESQDPYKTQTSDLPAIEFRISGNDEVDDIGANYNDVVPILLTIDVRTQGTAEKGERLFGEVQEALLSDHTLGGLALVITPGPVEIDETENEDRTYVITSGWMLLCKVNQSDPFAVLGA